MTQFTRVRQFSVFALAATLAAGMLVWASTAHAQGSYTVLHTFTGGAADGGFPQASLIQGPDGTLYGTTFIGGSSNFGTVFAVAPDASGFTILDTFTGGATDGAFPRAGLIQGPDGTLYGTTTHGGPVDSGTIFQMAPDGSGFTILHSFTGGVADGATPYGGLIQGPDGTLYGTTYNGGSGSAGTVFAVALGGGGFTILHSFTGADGANPDGGLIQGPDGTLYGTTYNGGSGSVGTVFSVAPDGGGFTILHSFTGGLTDGSNPAASLIQGPDGTLYGTTYFGGSGSSGTVFAVAPGGGFTILHSFTGGDGSSPAAGLIQGPDGTLYGTTNQGGSGGVGAVFAVAPDGSGFTILHNFTGGVADGANPFGGLIQGLDGAFYGTTVNGGTSDLGVVFRLILGP